MKFFMNSAGNLSARSLELLIPTFRTDDAEVWFSWNPNQPDDPVQEFFDKAAGDPRYPCVHVNYLHNPFCTKKTLELASDALKYNPDSYGHIWLGEFNVRSQAIVFSGRYVVDEFDPSPEWQPMYGLDWGFSQDPTVAVEVYVNDGVLYIYRAAGKVGLELDHPPGYLCATIPGLSKHKVRADSARPESISHVRRIGLPRIEGVEKWPSSVEDGISHMQSYRRIVIHPDCQAAARHAQESLEKTMANKPITWHVECLNNRITI